MRIRKFDEFTAEEMIKIKSNETALVVKGIQVSEKNKHLVDRRIK